jgi:hypothetical protein
MAFLDLSLEVKKTVPCLPYFLSQKDSKSTQSQVESAQTKLSLVLCSFQCPYESDMVILLYREDR